jgi:hypothetical protein
MRDVSGPTTCEEAGTGARTPSTYRDVFSSLAMDNAKVCHGRMSMPSHYRLEQDTTSLEVELRSISCGPNASMCRVLGRSMSSITCTTLRSFHNLATRTALTWLRPISDLNMYILPPVVCKSARSDASPPLHPGFPRGSRLHLGCSDHDLAVPQNSPSPSMYSTTCNSNSTRISISTLV